MHKTDFIWGAQQIFGGACAPPRAPLGDATALGRLTQVLELHWNLLTLLCQSAMKSRQPKTCFLCLKYGTSNMHIFFSKLLEMFVTHSRTYVFLNLNIIIIFNPLHSNFPGGLHLFLIS